MGYGKVILLGEHAVVYGRHAIAVPLPLTTRAVVDDAGQGVELLIPRWGVEYQLAKPPEQRRSFERAAGAILDRLGLTDRNIRIEVFPGRAARHGPRRLRGHRGGHHPRARPALRPEAHRQRRSTSSPTCPRRSPTASRAASTTRSRPTASRSCYRRGTPPLVEPLNIRQPLHLVIGMTHAEGLTAKTVGNVREARERNPRLYEKIFDDIDALVLQAVSAIQDNDFGTLGELMNVCQGLLNALQVSTPELERLIGIARGAGALGAKLTGGGGGGAMVALCDGDTATVQQAIERQGFRAIAVTRRGRAMSALNAPANNPGDTLILVDHDDREIGFLSKEECHRGAGILHRAFSVFLFNRSRRDPAPAAQRREAAVAAVLVQQLLQPPAARRDRGGRRAAAACARSSASAASWRFSTSSSTRPASERGRGA